MKKYSLSIVFLIFSNCILGQSQLSIKQIDSLYSIYNTSSHFNSVGATKLTELYYTSKEIGYKSGQIKTLRKLADISVGSMQYTKGLEYINELKQLSLAVQDYDNYIMGCSLESKVLFIDHNYSKANELLAEARRYLSKIEDLEKRRKAKIHIDIYRWAIFQESKLPIGSYKDSLISLSKGIYHEALLLKDPNLRSKRILISANSTASVLIQERRGEEALKYLEIAGKQIESSEFFDFFTADFFEAKGDYEYQNFEDKVDYLDSALAHYKTALKIAEKIHYGGIERKLYPKIAQVYKDKKDLENVNIYLEKGLKLNEKHDYDAKKNLNELKKSLYITKDTNYEKNNWLYVFIPAIIFLLTMSLFVFLFRNNFFNRQPSPIKNMSAENSSETLPKIDERKLSTNKLLELLNQNDASFFSVFLQFFPDFEDKLVNVNPAMKSSDIEFCAMIMLHLDTKKIAQIKGVSIKSVESKKYRIRKKLQISMETDMCIWLSSL